MKIHNEYSQSSLEWLAARAGVLTASEASSLVTPKFKIREGEMVDTLLARKLAEKWIGPLPGFNTLEMDFGKILEEEARPWVSFEINREVTTVGFITTDDGKCGCSPDGLIDGIGLEIKSPEPTNHVKYLMGDAVPDIYLGQVHFSMWVTGYDHWMFVSYRRNFPKLLLTVKRDEGIMKTIGEAAKSFIERLDASYAKLCEMNGGPPKRLAPKPEHKPESFDVIP